VDERPAGKRGLGIALVAVCATLLTSACTAGQQASTAHVVPAVDASSGDLGTIQLRDVAIKPPPNGPSYAIGDAAELQLVVVNVGRNADRLTGVTTPAASGFQVFATEAEAQAAASPTPTVSPLPSDSGTPSGSGSGSGSGTASGSGSASGSATDSETASGSATDSASASASASTSSAAPPTPAPSLAVPPGQALSLSVLETDPVLLLKLTKALFPGPSVPITFTFANAGSITFRVPVQITPYSSPLGVTIPPISTPAVEG
jgi:copper(I)-binding protein